MKASIFSVSFFIFACAVVSGQEIVQSHYIGESYSDGIVIFVTTDGKHGLIAAKNDQIYKTKSKDDILQTYGDPRLFNEESEYDIGWKVPNYAELRIIYETKNVIGNISEERNALYISQYFLWSAAASGRSSQYEGIYMYNGKSYDGIFLGTILYIRLVKRF